MKKLLPVFLLLAYPVMAQQFPPVIPNTYIQDHANVLNANQRTTLEDKVRQLKTARDIEFALITVPTTGGYDIHEYGTAIGRAYGIGSKDGEHRGLLVLLAIQDRHWTIQPSRHLEGIITDGQTGNIGRGMVPFLKQENYYGAFNYAVDQLTPLALQADIKQQQVVGDQPKPETGVSLWIILPIGLVGTGGLVWLFMSRRRKKKVAPTSEKKEQEFPILSPPPFIYPSTPAHPRREKPRVVSSVSRDDDEPSSSPSWPSSPFGSSDSSGISSGGSSDSGGFGGTSDFGGGGSSGSW